MTRWTRIACLALAALAPACRGAAPRSTATVRDSAGIRIVENSGPLWPAGGGWRLDSVPALAIGVVQGEEPYQLADVRGVARYADGRIVLANGGSSEIRIFDVNGRFLRSIGREGAGPGEFQYLRRLFLLPGDSLLVVSGFGNRYTVFDPAGQVASISTTPSVTPLARFGDGTFLTTRYAQTVPAGQLGFVQDTVVYSWYGSRIVSGPDIAQTAGNAYDPKAAAAFVFNTIARVTGNQEYRSEVAFSNPVTSSSSGGTRVVSGRGIFNDPVPFTPRAVQAVRGQELFTGSGATFQIAVYAHNGGLRRIIRLNQPNRKVTGADIDGWKQELQDGARNNVQRTHAQRLITDMKFPDAMAAFSAMLVDSDGDLWVERYRVRSNDAQHWVVFDPDGRCLGDIDTPARFDVNEIGDDYLLGVWRSADDVPFVRLYAIHKQP